MTIIKTGNSVGEDVEKRELLCTVGGKIGTATVENSVESPQKIKNRNTTCSNNLIGGSPKEME